ncbi:MAG TPA: NUDIX domain-containing protein [Actinocrinis sp.]|nr:NUDIX domain-containing protein [Actinocrinis sp.]
MPDREPDQESAAASEQEAARESVQLVGRPLAVDARGDALLSFVRAGEVEAPPGDAPLNFASIALWHEDRVLMVFERKRRQWELPGGAIEPGETLREAASRELLEESGQQSDLPLRFLGYAHFALAGLVRIEYGALFTGRVAEPVAFEPTSEIEAVRWWNPSEPFVGDSTSLDAYLVWLTQ